MVDVIILDNSLYYVYGNPMHGSTYAKWLWNKAPARIKALYRKRPDFWAVAPYCIAKEYLPRF